MAYELIKVSELPELTTPSDPNVLPIQDGDYLKRISFENLKEAVTGDVAGDLAAEVTARESAVSGEATARGNADTAILADLASPYSASATYAVGDYCTKDGQLYRCTTAISTAEAWTAAHWSAVALGDDTRDLRSALTNMDDDIYKPIFQNSNDWEIGGLSYSKSSGWTYTSNNKAIRPKNSVGISLKKDTIISLGDFKATLTKLNNTTETVDLTLDVYWKNTEGIPKTISGQASHTSDFVCPEDGIYMMIIKTTVYITTSFYTDAVDKMSGALVFTRTQGSLELDVLNSKGYVDAQGENLIVPDYYFDNDYLSDKIATINDNAGVINGCTFAFITDMHILKNSQSSKALIKYLIDKSLIQFVVSGGDICVAYPTIIGKEEEQTFESANIWREWVKYWGENNVYQLRGNHDYYMLTESQSDPNTSYLMPEGENYQNFMGYLERHVNGASVGYVYYYFDNPTQKTRYIVLDPHAYNVNYPNKTVIYIKTDQKKWLGDLLSSSDGYNIILFCHEPIDPDVDGYDSSLSDVFNMVSAFKTRQTYTIPNTVYAYDFTAKTGNLLAVISGHGHDDDYHLSSDGVLSIETTCDAMYPWNTRVRGTVDECAFDVFSFDYTAKTIKATRIGYGADRNWTYT